MLESIKSSVILRMQENLKRIATCIQSTDQDLLWKSANVSSNSIGHLILHLNGNITQYILSCLGGSTDNRERHAEFDTDEYLEKEIILKNHKNVILQSIQVIKSLNEEQLKKKYKVQGFEMTGIDILVHVVEHYSYHTGQIAFWIKLNLDTDLGFYKDMDLNVRNV